LIYFSKTRPLVPTIGPIRLLTTQSQPIGIAMVGTGGSRFQNKINRPSGGSCADAFASRRSVRVERSASTRRRAPAVVLSRT
jgi:hypothetical protein